MKLYGERIAVRLNDKGQPAVVRWRLSLLRVRAIEEQWVYAGKWWTTPQLKGRRREYFRLACIGAGGSAISLEIYRENDEWTLSRVLD